MRSVKKYVFISLSLVVCGLYSSVPFSVSAQIKIPTLSVLPMIPIQGDPLMVVVQGTSTAQIFFAGKQLNAFSYKNSSTALYGFDINKKPGTYTISAKLSDGQTLTKDIVVSQRIKPELTFSIPEKLGGNTSTGQAILATTLAAENASLLGLYTGRKAFWTLPFSYPLSGTTTVTDPYGYSRVTGATTILHKGTDFHAPQGTPVLAINRGVVRLVQETRNYGKTIVVDHGLGLMSFYMHLSKIYVNQGELVNQGQVIGLSGHTGYAEAAHLHLTIRIGDISVDPMRFMSLFKQ